MPDEAAIDAIKYGMTQPEVLAILGEAYKVLPAELGEGSLSVSWLYRDRRHSGGYTYIYFDHEGHVARIAGSVTFGHPVGDS